MPPPEGQFVWHQSRTAGVLYFTHLLSWALSRSALSATTDASTTQQAPCENNTASGICGLPPRTLITGARVTDQLRFSTSRWRNFSRRASCHLIRCPHVLGHTWRTCPRDSVLQHASHLLSASGLPRAARCLVDTVADLIWRACIKFVPVNNAVPLDPLDPFVKV